MIRPVNEWPVSTGKLDVANVGSVGGTPRSWAGFWHV